jgi:hypothetical protein
MLSRTVGSNPMKKPMSASLISTAQILASQMTAAGRMTTPAHGLTQMELKGVQEMMELWVTNAAASKGQRSCSHAGVQHQKRRLQQPLPLQPHLQAIQIAHALVSRMRKAMEDLTVTTPIRLACGVIQTHQYAQMGGHRSSCLARM